MKRKSRATKIMAVAIIAFLLVGTQFLSTAFSQSITSKIIDKHPFYRQETVNITCRVFTKKGVETITKAITKNEKARLDEQLNKTKEAVRIIHDEEAGFFEKKKAYTIIKETSIKLKQLDLLPERLSIQEATSLLSGTDGKYIFNSRSNYVHPSLLHQERLFYLNAYCFMEATATLRIIEITALQFPLTMTVIILGHLLLDCGWENTIIGKILYPIWIFLSEVENMTHNMPKLAIPAVYFVGLPLGSNYCTLETQGLLGHWKITSGFRGIAFGFIGIWLPKHIFGYTAGIIAKS